ncbi:MAG: B12-binding domain-containing radical SAM protein [Elusimicrobia bacterium]|nr:B12-binding domain-containing radical SAM protein [Elusimicrobiota bacterium]
MKILLINPSWTLTQNRFYAGSRPLVPPIGLAYIAAVLENDGFEVFARDQSAAGSSNASLVLDMLRIKPDVIAFSCFTVAMENVNKIISLARTYGFTGKIILGNVHPTALPDVSLRDTGADIVVRGEGEISMLEACRALKSSLPLKGIKGISYQEAGKIVNNPDRELIEDLDSLPYPAWHLFDISIYKDCFSFGSYNENMLSVTASRGCVNRCSFCAQHNIFPGIRLRKIKNVVDEIEYMYEKYGVDRFGFPDSCFPISEKIGLEFTGELVRRGLHKKIAWHCQNRVNMVTERLLKNMSASSCRAIFYGFESGNQRVLYESGKNTELSDAYNAMKWTKKARIRSSGFFMFGLPGDNWESCLDTIKFARRLDPDMAVFNSTIPYPGTDLYDMIPDKEKYEYESFNSWGLFASVDKVLRWRPDGMSNRQVKKAHRRGIMEFYLRPWKIWKLLVDRVFPLRYLLYGGFVVIVIVLSIVPQAVNRLKAGE